MFLAISRKTSVSGEPHFHSPSTRKRSPQKAWLTSAIVTKSGKVKAAAFHGKDAYVAQRELSEQAAYLCTFVLKDTTDDMGVVRYPVGHWPFLDPESKEVIIDSHGRRSYTTSVAFGPSLGQNIAMGYLPADRAKEGYSVLMEYFGCFFPAKIVSVGYRALLDPDNERVRS